MLRLRGLIRDNVVPDIQVKMLKLCLSDDENGIVIPTSRLYNNLEYRNDYVFREILADRINAKQTLLPLTIRKIKIYTNTLKELEVANLIEKIENMSTNGQVPITMRKYLLYNQCRAG